MSRFHRASIVPQTGKNATTLQSGIHPLDQRIHLGPRLVFALGQRFQFPNAPGLGLLGLSSLLSLPSHFRLLQKLADRAPGSQLRLGQGHNLAQPAVQANSEMRLLLGQAQQKCITFLFRKSRERLKLYHRWGQKARGRTAVRSLTGAC